MFTREQRSKIAALIFNAAPRVRTLLRLSGRVAEIDGHARGEDDESVSDTAILYGPYGWYGYPPPKKTETVSVPLGGAASQQAILGTHTLGQLPTDLEEGDAEAKTVHGSRIRMGTDGYIKFAPGPSGTFLLTLSPSKLRAENDMDAARYLAHGNAPAAVTGNPQVQAVTIEAGNDTAFVLKIVVAGGAATGTICTVIFSNPFPVAPIPVWAPKAGKPDLNFTNSDAAIIFTSTSLPVGTYEIAVHVICPVV